MAPANIKTNTKIFILLSAILSLIVLSPNIIRLINFPDAHRANNLALETACRFLVLFFLSWMLFAANSKEERTAGALPKSIALAAAGFLLALFIQSLLGFDTGKIIGMLIFQFMVVLLVCILSGTVYKLHRRQAEMEQENELLKIESLQSRCDALANQINPHFFFNTLNTMSSLIRENLKEKSLEYIEKLSVVFRYILQSDGKGMVALEEELDFLESYKFLLEVRFENKFHINMDIEERYRGCMIPVLSLLPLVENAVKHNEISSDKPMTIDIRTEGYNLMITNDIHHKLNIGDKIGIGLSNLGNRFSLLAGREITIERTDETFRVILPLYEPEKE